MENPLRLLPFIGLILSTLNTPVGTAHFIKNTEKRIENTQRNDGRSPKPDKNAGLLMIRRGPERKT